MYKRRIIILLMIFNSASLLFAQSSYIQYHYDNLNRLQRVEYPNGTIIIYTYDQVGNRLSKTVTTDPNIPTADFTASPTSGEAPLPVTFTDASVAGANPIDTWEWDFNNDGTIDATGQGPHTHTYNSAGTYSVKLTVYSGSSSNSKVKVDHIAVTLPPGVPPAASFSADDTYGTAPFTVTFTDGSTPGSDPIISWEWDFQNDGIVDATGQGPHVHTYSTPGDYSVRLTVSDGSLTNFLIRQDFIAVVDNQAPIIANNIPNQNLTVGGADFTRDLEASPVIFTDPDGDQLTYLASSSDNSVAIANMMGSVLTVSPVGEGIATITIEGDDSNGGTNNTTFQVAVGTVQFAEDFLWAKSAGGDRNDGGYSLVVDSQGNIIVTGFFLLSATFGSITINSSDFNNIFVAKYDGDGNIIWVRHITRGQAGDFRNGIAVDNNDNIYVVGCFQLTANFGNGISLTSAGDADVFVAKYNANGDIQWARRGGGPSVDYGYGIGVDDLGNCYISGEFMQTADFGSFNITSAGSRDIFLVKYNPSGTVLWARRAGNSGSEAAYDLILDQLNSVFLTGSFSSSTISFGTTTLTNVSNNDIFLVKYDQNGNALWANMGGGLHDDNGYGIGIDGLGNVVITGYFVNSVSFGFHQLSSVGAADLYIAKCDGNGNWVWAQRGGGVYDELGYGVTTNANNQILVTGFFNNQTDLGGTNLTSSGGYDVFVSSLDESGNFNWAKRGGSNSTDIAYNIICAGSGEGVLTGYAGQGATFSPVTLSFAGGDNDIFVAKLNDVTITNHPPTVINPINDQSLYAGGDVYSRDLEAAPPVFDDQDSDALTYTSSSSNTDIAAPEIMGTVLTVTPLGTGTAAITVTAYDGNGGQAQTQFVVTVEPATYTNSIPSGNSPPVTFGQTGVAMDFSNSLGGDVTVSHYTLVSSNADSLTIPKYWDITSTMQNGTFLVDVEFSYQDTDTIGLNEGALLPAYYDTSLSTWVVLSDFTLDEINNKVTVHNLDHFTEFTIGEQGAFTDLGTIGKVSPNVKNSDLVLSWNSVQGAEQYNIYRSTTPYFTPSTVYATVADTYYVDVGAAIIDTTDYFYKVSAANSVLETVVSNEIGKSDFTLLPGWNLISLPVLSSETSIDSVIGSQLTGGANVATSDVIYYYDGGTYQSAWYHEATQKWFGTLTDIEPDKGYWVKILSEHTDTLLTFVGSVSDTARTIPIAPGWNMVGSAYPVDVPLSESNLAGSGFTGASTPAQSDKIYEYSDGVYSNAWLYAPTSAWFGTLTSLKPGKGYWIWVLDGHSGFIWDYTRQLPAALAGGGKPKLAAQNDPKDQIDSKPDKTKIGKKNRLGKSLVADKSQESIE